MSIIIFILLSLFMVIERFYDLVTGQDKWALRRVIKEKDREILNLKEEINRLREVIYKEIKKNGA